jgi:phosphoribosyl-AMP cyclohydrolase
MSHVTGLMFPATAAPPICYNLLSCSQHPSRGITIIIIRMAVCDGRCSDWRQTELERTPAAKVAGFLFVPAMNLDFQKADGLITAVIQDHASGRVLMVGYMNEEAFRESVETGFATFYSRSRRKLWRKGETSGHRLAVKEISTDCDRDAVLVKVEALGPGVCHEGYRSCFFRRLENGEWKVSEAQSYDPAGVYGGPA